MEINIKRVNDETININGINYYTFTSHRLRQIGHIEREMNQLQKRLYLLEGEARRLIAEILDEEGE